MGSTSQVNLAQGPDIYGDYNHVSGLLAGAFNYPSIRRLGRSMLLFSRLESILLVDVSRLESILFVDDLFFSRGHRSLHATNIQVMVRVSTDETAVARELGETVARYYPWRLLTWDVFSPVTSVPLTNLMRML